MLTTSISSASLSLKMLTPTRSEKSSSKSSKNSFSSWPRESPAFKTESWSKSRTARVSSNSKKFWTGQKSSLMSLLTAWGKINSKKKRWFLTRKFRTEDSHQLLRSKIFTSSFLSLWILTVLRWSKPLICLLIRSSGFWSCKQTNSISMSSSIRSSKTVLTSILTQVKLIRPKRMLRWNCIRIRWGWGCNSRFKKDRSRRLRLRDRGRLRRNRLKFRRGLYLRKGWAQKMWRLKAMKIHHCRFSLIILSRPIVRMKVLSIQIRMHRVLITVCQIIVLLPIRKRLLYLMRNCKRW